MNYSEKELEIIRDQLIKNTEEANRIAKQIGIEIDPRIEKLGLK